MLFRLYVCEDELFMVWYKKGGAFETAASRKGFGKKAGYAVRLKE
jgi:hypothetical protein